MRYGFSLVELSIVLVILGLLTGGILAGQSLIRASELRAVTSEYQRYAAATQTFRDKYFAVPGDFRDATRFWTRQVGTADCVTNSGAAVSTPGACDGNGDGRIDSAAAVSAAGEMYQYWRQMALAGLIEGSYTGLAGPGTPTAGWDCVIGSNVPRSKISNVGWSTRQLFNYAGDGGWYGLDYGNLFTIGGQATGTTTMTAAFKSEEAWNIDTKLDDGKPGAGKVVTNWSNNCTNSASQVVLTGDYNLSSTSVNCAIHFRQQF
jgi:prepilin-type N-terminal cleavage/methylation domain-containing protein